MKKLLDEVRVEWMLLGNVADYEQPSKYLVKSQNYNNDFETPVLTAGKTFILGYTDETDGIYEASKNPVIIFDDFTTTNKWVDFDFKVKSSAMKMITSKNESEVLLKYIYYWLNTLPNELIEGNHRRQWISNFSNKLIPIPSIHIQIELVRILDTFSELTTELTTEFTARKKQYRYYRDKLLTFEDGEVEWKVLGEVCQVTSGGTPLKAKAEYWEHGNIPWLKSESCNNEAVRSASNFISDLGLKNSSAKLLEKETTLIALVGATIFKTAFLEFEATTNQNIASIKSYESNILKDKYIFYYITNLYDVLRSKMRNYSMLNLSTLKQFQIPIPPITEQNRIVSILDKFDAITTSITEGLPREIELRQKQYEYYRDLLLSFPKEEVE
jgi:type I restriction enzyme S subunit